MLFVSSTMIGVCLGVLLQTHLYQYPSFEWFLKRIIFTILRGNRKMREQRNTMEGLSVGKQLHLGILVSLHVST